MKRSTGGGRPQRPEKGHPGSGSRTRSGTSGHARRRAERKSEGNPDRRSSEAARPLGTGPVRLNRYIARSGQCSRREADTLIAGGQVRINGAIVTELGTKVAADDRVEVGGRVISPLAHVHLLLNKPADTITTTDDERDRRTVLDLLDLPGSAKAGLFPVGRLDRDTLGVLLITNDGELAHRLMHPSFGVSKIYRVRTADPIRPHEIDRLREGIDLEDGPARADDVTYVNPVDHHEVGLSVHEGRNRLVRRMFEALGHRVEVLERVRYGELTTEGVRRGHWRKLTPKEVGRLYRLVKLKP